MKILSKKLINKYSDTLKTIIEMELYEEEFELILAYFLAFFSIYESFR